MCSEPGPRPAVQDAGDRPREADLRGERPTPSIYQRVVRRGRSQCRKYSSKSPHGIHTTYLGVGQLRRPLLSCCVSAFRSLGTDGMAPEFSFQRRK